MNVINTVVYIHVGWGGIRRRRSLTARRRVTAAATFYNIPYVYWLFGNFGRSVDKEEKISASSRDETFSPGDGVIRTKPGR